MHAFLKGGDAAKAKKLASKSSEKAKTEKHKPWVEKYRPKSVDEVAHQDEVVSVLKKSLEGSDLPNMLFYGPPGTGKTSTILALARDLYGPELFKERVLELNASDDRGISVVREKVKTFAQVTVRNHGSKKYVPPFKIVILDEADSMTKAAQEALRRTMEKQTKTTRFCLICNYVTRIISPITSRCSKFRFKSLSEADQKSRLLEICEKESVKISDLALENLVKCSEGDLRKSVTYLQTAHRLKGEEGIDINDTLEITGVIPETELKSFIDSCSTNSYDSILQTVKNIINSGFAASQLINQLHDEIVVMPHLTDEQKCIIGEKLANVDKCLTDGADEFLQLMSLATTIQHEITA